MKPTGPTNPVLKNLVEDLRSRGYKEKSPFLISLSERLSVSSRRRSSLNLSRLERIAENGETVVVPGVLLGTGNLSKKITIYAWKVSDSAVTKIEQSGSKVYQLQDLAEKNPKGTNVRIVI